MACFATPYGLRYAAHCFNRAYAQNNRQALIPAGGKLGVTSGALAFPLLVWVGAGMTIYGALYALVHDGLVHRRFPFPRSPRSGYAKRLVQAHRLHHANRKRDGGVSFGFIFAPPVQQLRRSLRENGTAQ